MMVCGSCVAGARGARAARRQGCAAGSARAARKFSLGWQVLFPLIDPHDWMSVVPVLQVRGALVLRAGKGVQLAVRSLSVSNAGWTWRALGPNEDAPEEQRIRCVGRDVWCMAAHLVRWKGCVVSGSAPGVLEGVCGVLAAHLVRWKGCVVSGSASGAVEGMCGVWQRI
eukprot:380557-Pelagomonas_calceolata.AAC.2